MPIGTKEAAQELAHYRHRTTRIQDKQRKRRRLMDAPPNAHSGQCPQRVGERHGQHNGPFPLVIARSKRAPSRNQLDVIQDHFAIDRLAHIDPSLPQILIEPSLSR